MNNQREQLAVRYPTLMAHPQVDLQGPISRKWPMTWYVSEGEPRLPATRDHYPANNRLLILFFDHWLEIHSGTQLRNQRKVQVMKYLGHLSPRSVANVA